METPENDEKRRNIAEYDLRMPLDAGFDATMLDGRLFEVSLVRNPLNPHTRIVSVSTPAGYNRVYEMLRDGQDQEC